MHLKSFALILMCLLLFIPTLASDAYAISIVYEAADLPDSSVGKDLWQYKYFLNDHTFGELEGFDIYFTLGLYDNLTPVSQPNDWDVLVFQPDASIPANGQYDAMALVDTPSLAEPFIVSFVWLGSGTPGAQLFEIYNDMWEVTAEGNTSPVPEPATILLVAFGIIGIAGLKKGNHRRV